MVATRPTSAFEAELGLATAGDVVASYRQLDDDLSSTTDEIHCLCDEPWKAPTEHLGHRRQFCACKKSHEAELRTLWVDTCLRQLKRLLVVRRSLIKRQVLSMMSVSAAYK